MSRVCRLAWCDLRLFLLQGTGWIVPAIFLFGAGLVFVRQVFVSGRPATMHAAFGFDALFIMLAGPALVMGCLAQERRRGTLELLLSTPASSTQIVLGKWLGGMGLLVLLLVPTLVQVALLESHGRPDHGEIAAGYLGLLLLGGAVLATAVAASAVLAGQAVVFLVTCLGWVMTAVVLEVALPTVLGPSWRAHLIAVDPLARFQDFSLGLFDSGNVVYFLAIIVFFLVVAVTAIDVRRSPRGSTVTGLCGLFVALVTLVALAMSPNARVTVDLTKSRAYSLSPRTSALLGDLEGDWQIRVALEEARTQASTLTQIDEVLGRFAQAAPSLRVMRIDPTDPASMIEWEQVLATLGAQASAATEQWREAIKAGVEAFDHLVQFAQVSAGPLRAAAPAGRPGEDLRAGASALALLAAQGHRVLDSALQRLETGPDRPLPDWATARAILVEALSRWSMELDGLGRRLGALDGTRYAHQASALALAADRLSRLPDLPSADLSRHLEEGEAAVITGPGGSRVIPMSRILPQTLTDVDAQGRVRFDQRFRGEQLIAAAIESLADDRRMRVVFVHDQDGSILDAASGHEDVSAVASMLGAGGIAVSQWAPHRTPSPPQWDHGPTAWVVIPPVSRPGLKTAASEQALLDATRSLMARGEGVLVSVFPGPHARLGRMDPWATLLAPHGIDVDSTAVLLRDVGADMPEVAMELHNFPAPHPVGAALHGQSLVLPLAVQVRAAAHSDAVELGEVQPGPALWLEDDWHALVSTVGAARRTPPSFKVDAVPDAPIPVIAATVGKDGGRLMVVGSGNWMRSAVADAAVSAGGDRMALVHPGNHELMTAGVAWVAGLDDRIARGALSQDLARLGGIPRDVHTFWAWVLCAGLPAGSLGIGLCMALWRRT